LNKFVLNGLKTCQPRAVHVM